jgi:hypothetical protein
MKRPIINMTSYYSYEERFGRRRINRDAIENSQNVIDLEPYVISKHAIVRKRNAQRIYDWYLRNGYELIDLMDNE